MKCRHRRNLPFATFFQADVLSLRIVLVWALIPALTNCSTAPLVDDVTRKTTYAVVERIRCEARRAVTHYGKDYTTAAIAYEFSFQITEADNSSGSLKGFLPFLNGGSFSVVANTGVVKERNTVRNFKIVDSFEELRQADCSEKSIEKNWNYPIAGDIGVYEVVSTFIKLQKVNNPEAGDVFTFADKLKFTTAVNGGIQPILTLNPIPGKFRVAEASADFHGGRVDIHEVSIALAGGPDRKRATDRGIRVDSIGATANAGSLVSTTILQSVVNPKYRALLELDRQQIRALQDRAQSGQLNLLIGP